MKKRNINVSYLLSVLILFISIFVLSSTSQAASWICGNGNWNNTGCWDWWDYPSDNEDVWITDTLLLKAKTVNYVNGSYNPTLNNLYIESRGGYTTILKQAQDTLTVNYEYIGKNNGGKGAYEHTAGTHKVNNSLYLGYSFGSSGTYDLSGTGILSAAYEEIGNEGTGTFTQSGGTHTVSNDLFLSYNPGSSGTYDLSGGDLSVGKNEYVGYLGTGIFTQSGGTNTVSNNLNLGTTTGSSGTYDLSGTGILSANNESIGL